MFPIMTCTNHNIEWVSPFLCALHHTLGDKSRPVYIFDSTLGREHDILQSLYKFDLNVVIKRIPRSPESRPFKHILTGMKTLSDKMVCMMDIDTLMLLPNWDLYLEQKLRENIDMVSIAPRFTTWAEPQFMLVSSDICLESGMLNANRVKNWDMSVMKKPTGTGEHASVTYLHHKYNKRFLLFTKSWRQHISTARTPVRCSQGDDLNDGRFNETAKIRGTWGHVVYDDYGREFLYHNFFSARHQPESACPVSELARTKFNAQLEACPKNTKILLEYFLDMWPSPMVAFISNLQPLAS